MAMHTGGKSKALAHAHCSLPSPYTYYIYSIYLLTSPYSYNIYSIFLLTLSPP